MENAVKSQPLRIAAPFEIAPRRVSFATFYRKYIRPGDGAKSGVKYEFNNGIVEKTVAMKLKEQHLAVNLMGQFGKSQAAANGNWLMPEVEIWTTATQWRKPDLCYLTKEQIRVAADGVESVPEFVIEVISTFDPINIVNDKVLEYFGAGVKVLWHIFPQQQMVYVFKSLADIAILRGEDVCDAAPILPDFRILAADIFKN